MQGSPIELVRSGVDFIEMVGTVDTPEIKENTDIFKRQKSKTLSIRSTSTESSNSFTEFQEIESAENAMHTEGSSKGKVKGSLFANYFRAGANWFILIFLCTFFLFVQVLGSSADFWVAIWYVYIQYYIVLENYKKKNECQIVFSGQNRRKLVHIEKVIAQINKLMIANQHHLMIILRSH